MKLHYSKILLFSLSLIILVISSSNAHNKNKPYITPHTPTPTSRVLIECNIYMPNYDNDPYMNSVMENFHKQSEQRFHEYDKRMIKNRQKRKEQCDKDIKEIIEKDKINKSLAEKVEKGCLKCGYGLGGVAASISLLGTVVVNELTNASTAAAVDLAIQKGIESGVKVVINAIKDQAAFAELKSVPWSNFINGSNYNTVHELLKAFGAAIDSTGENCATPYNGRFGQVCNAILTDPDGWLGPIAEAGEKASTSTIKSVKAANLSELSTTSTHLYSAIGYSVIALLIILLVMVIIYLILRYRRKKKMNKKLQYTKLLS
ncbi:PIR protein, putative [Plasmodium sp. gorilla clade G1]|nr:PIR protein, putative [Plasmodium sp. gorilla clade G1]